MGATGTAFRTARTVSSRERMCYSLLRTRSVATAPVERLDNGRSRLAARITGTALASYRRGCEETNQGRCPG